MDKKEVGTIFAPTVITINDIVMDSFGAFIAGIIGSVLLLVMVFSISSLIDIPGNFTSVRIGSSTNILFPFVLSLFSLLAGIITTITTYYFLNLISPERYGKSDIHFTQIAFFSLIVYFFITPGYVITGMQSYDNIMYIFIFHMIILMFGASLILEVLNNYRYILIGIYGSFIALFLSAFISVIIFSFFSGGLAKLIILLVLLPLINFMITFFKELFELIYFKYYKYTGLDPLGDVFHRIIDEEEERIKKEEEENNLY